MKMNLAIPYDSVNRRGQYMSKQVVLDALYRKGFNDRSIVINEKTKIIFVLIDVIDIKEDGVVEFTAEFDENEELFPIAPPIKP
jgi:hypothetical protein